MTKESWDRLRDQRIVEIDWRAEDALEFPLCISSLKETDCTLIEDVSVARGNVILVDHGRRETAQLPAVPPPGYDKSCDGERRPVCTVRPVAYRPWLDGPLVHREPIPPKAPAASLLDQDPSRASPQLNLSASGEGCEPDQWLSVPDLFDSSAHDPHFVVEMDDGGRGHLRFGNDDLG